jgi:hypothetical protein
LSALAWKIRLMRFMRLMEGSPPFLFLGDAAG